MHPVASAIRLVRSLAVTATLVVVASPATAEARLPDLIVRPELLHQTEIDRRTIPGRELLRITSGTANIGTGPLELRGGAIIGVTESEVAQRIYRTDGTWFDRLAGVFTYHPSHGHVHFDDWTVFRLREVLEDGGVGAVVAEGSKISFCILDDVVYDPANPFFVDHWVYGSCGFEVQGISPGWGDTYDRWLPDQWIDITGIPDGTYWLEVEVDPNDRLVESNEDNNVARVPILLRPPEARADRYEENDSFDEVAARDPGEGSPALGAIDARRVLDDLSMDDTEDVFSFRLDRPAESMGFVRISSPWSVDDLNLYLYDSGRSLVAASESPTNTEEVSLAGLTEGTWFIRVTARSGTNPGYTIIIDPSGDPCPPLPEGDPRDTDGDRLADSCDNCPLVANRDQADANHDGAGDACQPALSLAGVDPGSDGTLVARVTARDPQGDPLAGAVTVSGPRRRLLELQDALQGPDCGRAFLPDGTPGKGIGFTNGATGSAWIFDIDSWLLCDDGETDYVMAPGPCDQPDSSFHTEVWLGDLPPSGELCIRPAAARWGGITPRIERFDENSMSGILDTWVDGLLDSPFRGALPRRIALPAMLPGQVYELGIVLTDGTTPPVSARASFVYTGGRELAIDSPPEAVIAAPPALECDRPEGARVILDGGGSTDTDSSPGTHDDLVSFDWFEEGDAGAPRLLGVGERLVVVLPLGVHRLALRVTDSAGETDRTGAVVMIRDTIAPTLALSVDRSLLWPPDHSLLPVRAVWEARDACDPAVRVGLLSATSSEPDDAPGPGDGATTDDIQVAETGTSDSIVLLRAERRGEGPGRSYTLTYVATDRAGNTTSAAAVVRVPKSQRP